MAEHAMNIYQAARKTTDLTQEMAAEALNISVDSIRAYETGQRAPGVDIVADMVVVYGTDWLGPAHVQMISQELGVLPELQLQTLPTAVITLVNRVFAFADKHRDRELLQIAEDGRIDARERPVFDQIVQELNGIVAASFQVMYPLSPVSPGDKKRTAPTLACRSGSGSQTFQTENDCSNDYTSKQTEKQEPIPIRKGGDSWR